MDLGIVGRWAIVCAASKGLGKACAHALAAEGVHLVINARHADVLEMTAQEIRQIKTSGEVITVAGDITTPEVRAKLLAIAPQVDILINNAGGPPPGDFHDWTPDDWMKAVNANMITPIELIKATVDGMQERRFGRIVNITSSAVKAPIAILGLSNGARSGLTGFVAGIARTTVQYNVTINNLLPGSFDTDRIAAMLNATAQYSGRTIAQERAKQEEQVPARRFGTPSEFGDICAYLCSAQAGYITGQNILIDGGAYPGTF
ncbi:MAG: SDR family oxidoreductase [Saezia sp.]